MASPKRLPEGCRSNVNFRDLTSARQFDGFTLSVVRCFRRQSRYTLAKDRAWFHLFMAMGGQADIRQAVHFGRGVPVAPLPRRASSRHRSPRSFETGATLKLQYGRLPTSAVE